MTAHKTGHEEETEVRDVPFMKNDMKESAPTTGWPVDTPDAPGKADSEIADEENVDPSKQVNH